MLKEGGFLVVDVSTDGSVHTPNWHEYVTLLPVSDPWFMDFVARPLGKFVIAFWGRWPIRSDRWAICANIVVIASKRLQWFGDLDIDGCTNHKSSFLPESEKETTYFI
jgi:hypothetical protein